MLLRISYKSKKLERECSQFCVAKKSYGEKMAIKIHHRIQELQAATSIDMLIQCSIGRCHRLEGNRIGQFAMDLVHPYRLIFEQEDHQDEGIRILSIEDYH